MISETKLPTAKTLHNIPKPCTVLIYIEFSSPKLTPSGGDDENICPNLETTSHKADEGRISGSMLGKPEPPQPPTAAEAQAAEDGPLDDNFNDVSMMSVDGHMSVDFGPQESHST